MSSTHSGSPPQSLKAPLPGGLFGGRMGVAAPVGRAPVVKVPEGPVVLVPVVES